MTKPKHKCNICGMNGRSGRPISFWMAHEEIDGLQEAANIVGCSRNEAARRAVRHLIEAVKTAHVAEDANQ